MSAVASSSLSILLKRFCFYVTLIFFTLSLFRSNAQSNAVQPFVKVYGEVTKSLILYADDLAKMKRSTVTMKDHDGKEHNYTGVAIREIFERAGVTTGTRLRKENLTKYLLVKCTDGYQVLFSLAELDSSFTDRIAILADTSDGKPLSADIGPFRLVVPGEKKGARSCFKVQELLIKFAKE
ncbi:MAG TPA: molybdopterin-dependent oxidoreductase [Chitinophagaceae bacterium]|jgi:DMSO/TMAO reductase YedYZ molybdopterin-dependent catalytic subunit